MRVVTFAPALSATDEEAGGLSLRGFPMTSAFVDLFPVEITVSVVVVVCALAGEEYDAVRYLIADSPTGERVSTMEFRWNWPDTDDIPVKFRVFAQQLPLYLESEGTYMLSLADNPDGVGAEYSYPLPVFLNPNALPTTRLP